MNSPEAPGPRKAERLRPAVRDEVAQRRAFVFLPKPGPSIRWTDRVSLTRPYYAFPSLTPRSTPPPATFESLDADHRRSKSYAAG